MVQMVFKLFSLLFISILLASIFKNTTCLFFKMSRLPAFRFGWTLGPEFIVCFSSIFVLLENLLGIRANFISFCLNG